jgi:hypothetical protein
MGGWRWQAAEKPGRHRFSKTCKQSFVRCAAIFSRPKVPAGKKPLRLAELFDWLPI